MTVRSKRLFGPVDVPAGTTANLYECPTGFRTLWKSIHIHNRGGTAGRPVVYIGDSQNSNIIWSTSIAGPGDFVAGPSTWWVMLEASDIIQIAAPAGVSLSVYGSGAELAL